MQAQDYVFRDVVAADGPLLGRVTEVHVDQSGAPCWLGVALDGADALGGPGTRVRYLPAAGASTRAGRVLVPFHKDAVELAPDPYEAGVLSQVDEHLLYDHYRIDNPTVCADYDGAPQGPGGRRRLHRYELPVIALSAPAEQHAQRGISGT
jgi:hypothetical protein